MNTTIRIPKTVGEATRHLTGIESLLTAQRWERAAIVAAFVRLNDAPGRPSIANGGNMSTVEFAALGIAGLKSTTTVQTYVKRWLEHSDGVYPDPGAEVLLPDTEWEGTRTGTNGHNSTGGMRTALTEMVEAHGPEAVAEAVAETAAARPVYDKVRKEKDAEWEAKLAAVNERDEHRKSRSPFNEMRIEEMLDKAGKLIISATEMAKNSSALDRTAKDRILQCDVAMVQAHLDLLAGELRGESMDQHLADLLDREGNV